MSFIITVYTNEGIVMASDSRITYNNSRQLPDGTKEKNIGVQITDTAYKTFQCNAKVGLSTCGAASLNGVPIAGYIEDFISLKVSQNDDVDKVSQELINYFSQFTPIPYANFIVAGYNSSDNKQHVNRVRLAQKQIKSIDVSSPGAVWDGEYDILQRLIKNVALKNPDGTYFDLNGYNIGFNFFTLQDAIDFAQYAIDSTIKTMFFQDRVKTVGGPIDILAIKPSGAFWIQRKELHA